VNHGKFRELQLTHGPGAKILRLADPHPVEHAGAALWKSLCNTCG
jgi:hypothetical protein